MKKIAQMIVVEGKHDTQRLKRFFDCDTIETGGGILTEDTLKLIEKAQKQRGVIVFTDPDFSGNRLRRLISERIPEVQHAHIAKNLARTDKKVGIEHAEKKDLEESLSHLVTFVPDSQNSLSWSEFIDLGLIGNASLRNSVCQALHIGRCNAKTCFKRLNQLGLCAADVQKAIDSLQTA